jgi:preprotein translocase SecE subunit
MAEAVKVRNEETPSSTPGPIQAVPNWFVGKWRNFSLFLHEVRVETRQVTWPTKSDVQATTVVVIVTVFFFGLFLFFVDLGVSQLVDRVLKAFRP